MDKEPGLTVIAGGGGAGKPKSLQELLGASEDGIAGPYVLGNLPEMSPEDLGALKTGKPEVRFMPPNTSD